MAVREPAHPIEKRDLLHAESPNVSKITAIARKLAAEGRWPEAIDYLELVKDKDLLAKAESSAVERGSVWLLSQVARIAGHEIDPAQWRRLSESASRQERWRDAVRALSQAGDAEASEALRLEKCPEFEPFRPQGK
jgi:hypothetical protein